MSNSHNHQNNVDKGWLEDKRNVRKIITILFILCLGLFVADGFYHKHTYFGVESIFGFYAIYGFVMCVALVLIAKLIRKILMRAEDYYDKEYDND